MKKYSKKEQFYRELIKKNEKNNKLLKFIMINETLPENIRQKAFSDIGNKNKKYKEGLKNRCILTDRSKSVYKIFKLSRITFRKLALNGLLPGVKKLSW